MKFLFWLLGSLMSLAIAITPEVAMYFTYRLIDPQSDGARVLILGIFWLSGVGICLATAFFGLALFVHVTKAVLQ